MMFTLYLPNRGDEEVLWPEQWFIPQRLPTRNTNSTCRKSLNTVILEVAFPSCNERIGLPNIVSAEQERKESSLNLRYHGL